MKSSSILHGDGRKLYESIEKLAEKKITEGMRIDSSGDGYDLSANLGETLSFYTQEEREVLCLFARGIREREREEKCFWLLLFFFYP